jgi:hypothetical protein
MSRFETALHNDLQALAFVRDELALQTHLMTAELLNKWQELEVDWARLCEHLGRSEQALDKARRDTGAALELLADTLRKGYAGIRDTLTR